MKKDILKDLLAKPGKKHLVSDFDSSFTGDLSKQASYFLETFTEYPYWK